MADDERRGEDGGWELMELAEALPGSFTLEIRDDVTIYTKGDRGG